MVVPRWHCHESFRTVPPQYLRQYMRSAIIHLCRLHASGQKQSIAWSLQQSGEISWCDLPFATCCRRVARSSGRHLPISARVGLGQGCVRGIPLTSLAVPPSRRRYVTNPEGFTRVSFRCAAMATALASLSVTMQVAPAGMAPSSARPAGIVSRVSLSSSAFQKVACRRVGFLTTEVVASRIAMPEMAPRVQDAQFLVVTARGYKLKTHKASAKRFKVTGSGKIVCRHAWRQHLLRKKNSRRRNRLAGTYDICRGDIDKVVGALPYLKVNRQRIPNIQRFEDDGGVEEVVSS